MKQIISHKRRVCANPSCNGLTRNKGYYKGKTIYGKFCDVCHRGGKRVYFLEKQKIDNSKCEYCGWNKAFCDRHRIIPNKGYCRENIIVLCPNCHRLVTVGLLRLERLENGEIKSL